MELLSSILGVEVDQILTFLSQVAADVLRPANDWLWLAAALEGIASVFK